MTILFPSPEFDDAVAAVCHGSATEAEMGALNALLRSNAIARDEYLLRLELHARLASDRDLFSQPEDAGASCRLPDIRPGEGRNITLLTGQAVWGFFAALVGVRLFGGGEATQHAVLLGLLAAGAAFGARHALETLKLRRFGIEEGLVLLALGFELGALWLGLDRLGVPDRALGFALGWNLAALAAVAAGRWGIAGTGALAGCGLFGALALLPAPFSRLAWIAVALPLLFAARRIARLDRAAVAHRRRADELSVVSHGWTTKEIRRLWNGKLKAKACITKECVSGRPARPTAFCSR